MGKRLILRYHIQDTSGQKKIFPFIKEVAEGKLTAHVIEDNDGNEWEEVELDTLADESKNETKDNIYQLIAGMTKVAGYIAHCAVMHQKLFWEITIYGLLCDYAKKVVTEIRILHLDFRNRRSILYAVLMDSNLSIEEAINRAARKMERGPIQS